MQSFLPHPDFATTARMLDQRRLGKQRVETIQILRGLTVPNYGWRHHPAVKMWAGYEEALVRYGLEICTAWTEVGRSDTCELTLLTDLKAGCDLSGVRTQSALAEAGDLPPWLGDDEFHRSHRSALLTKDPEHYGRLFDDPPGLPYVWPSSDRKPCSRASS
ncbi:MSMEG_6728 family protein [Kribbella sp. CA-293567]|uniref:MSMEG_6728 family protein n=1 Tax=Kribbella sp. CA-293567 TaxID=3002436 RepID=UPI0022DD0B9E|nr:MSMEG_6728 family protein [Kribbella sp. CA-293567]WBQ08285.1 MSMEG_6728 family protein [Kribbella sp. CA-293567]